MKSRINPLMAALALLVLLLAALLCSPGAALAQRTVTRSTAPVTVNFINADIEAVSRAFAAMINRAIVVDPRVKGTITVYSEQPQSVRAAFQSFQSALRGLGFSVVESGGILKVVPEADAKLQTGTVSIGENVPIRGDQVITQIFTLRYENPNNLVAVLRPLISANNTINANPGSNSLVITDYADNLRRISQIISALDVPSGTDVEVVPLQFAVAADLAPLVQRLSEGGSTLPTPGLPQGIGGANSVTVVPDSRSNSLLVRAPNAAKLANVRATIARLDRPSTLIGPGGSLWVVHLKHADATRLATVVRAAFGALRTSGGNANGGGNIQQSSPTLPTATSGGNPAGGIGGGLGSSGGSVTAVSQPSTGGFIQADPATNSLIITAPEPEYRQVRALIDQLDTRRAQVYIESMIVEVSGDNSADFGFQWQGLLGNSGNKYGLIGGTNFNNPSPASNIIGISTGIASGQVNIGEGLNLGLLKNISGTITLAAIARALESQANTNIVSTPNLVTLDNEEAKIVVGQNVPFITGQFTGAGGGAGVTNPFQTIERKDVGVTLRIRPQIGDNGAIRMTIFQEQSSVLPTTAAGTSNAGPSTTKRSIEGTVMVDEGQILVLGGLIEDRFTTNQSKVPLLGDIPYLGALFRSESRQRQRTNLMVFIRPIVLRDADETNRLSLDRYEQIRQQQQAAQPARSIVIPINESPVLPERPVTPPPDEPLPANQQPFTPPPPTPKPAESPIPQPK
ncbi:MAG: type II secretion system secretin GspD [Pseudomonadota bacterium]|nr:type II secretion system secretin GspD [Pseudomonadota bacterium]